MPQEKVKRIHLIYGCISAVLIIALGIALILSCLDIYHSGPRPYSAEAITLRFRNIAILVYVCVAILAGGLILSLVLPLEAGRPKALRDTADALAKLKAKLPSLDTDTERAVRKERTIRIALRLTTAVVYAGLMVYPALYFLDNSHFTIASVNNDIHNAVCVALIPACAGLLLCFVCSILVSKSLLRETEHYKKAIGTAKSITVQSEPTQKKNAAVVVLRIAVLTIAVCFIIIGILNGGMKDVLDKAVAICTECIGLG